MLGFVLQLWLGQVVVLERCLRHLGKAAGVSDAGEGVNDYGRAGPGDIMEPSYICTPPRTDDK